MEKVLVTCALLFSGPKVLCAQRSATMPLPGLWEFPGGKIEVGERPEECLFREIKEELGVNIHFIRPLTPAEHSYAPGILICLLPYVCSMDQDAITLLEHQAIKWLGKDELKSLEWAPADIAVVEELMEKWNIIQEQLVDYTKET